MNVLVTGGTGFLGRHMVDALLDAGHTVLVLTRSEYKSKKKYQNLSFWKGDITIAEHINGITENIDIIYHFAAQLGEWGVPDDLFYSVNVKGTKNLLEYCKNQIYSPRFIFISTPGVQGKGNRKARESLPYNPPYIYEKTKCEAEKLVLNYHESYGIPIEIVRPDFVYGPGDKRRLPLYRAIQRKRFLIIGDGKSILHPTYIDDVINGLLLVGQHEIGFNEIFNVAGPDQLTVKAYTQHIAYSMGSTVSRLKVPEIIGRLTANLCEYYSRYSNCPPFISRSQVEFLTTDHGSDITKAKKLLKFKPQYGFEKGFKKTLDWASENHLL